MTDFCTREQKPTEWVLKGFSSEYRPTNDMKQIRDGVDSLVNLYKMFDGGEYLLKGRKTILGV